MRTNGYPSLAAALGIGVLSLFLGAPGGAATTSRSTNLVRAVGAESEYANVISQIGGRYVDVTSLLDNPNTDPHTFEASPRVAEEVSHAELIVQNGIGYDTFMNRIEAASSAGHPKIITVQHLLGLPDSTANPHLWYSPRTMPAVAKAIAADLSAIAPAHAAYFASSLRAFDRSLQPWTEAIASFKAKHHDVTVATTEPVADYLLSAMGIVDRTPFRFQADVMNGVDPSPQDITFEQTLLQKRQVQLFVYNQQVTDQLTASFRADATKAHVPVVGVYETMPTPGYDYQRWMLAEVDAIQRAVTARASTEHL